jgi:hypothetical protein
MENNLTTYRQMKEVCNSTLLFLTLGLILLLFSCKKPVAELQDLPDSLENGLLTLNEGLFQQNNSSLTWFDLQTQQVYTKVFEAKNGIGIGDTGNDMGIYGGKIYIVVNNSHILHVLDRKTGLLLGQRSLTNNNSGSSPRQIRFYEEYAYISAFDGSVFKLDTVNFLIEKIAIAGTNPDAMCVVGDKLLVSNSGGLTSTGDSTISVFQLPALNEIQRITVGRNPGRIAYDTQQFIYVVSRGNYTSIPTKLVKINTTTWEVESSQELPVGSVLPINGKLYLSHYESNEGVSKLVIMNAQTGEIENDNCIAGLSIQTLYGMQYMQIMGQDVIVLSDAKGYINQGKVLVLDLNGNLLFEYTSGLNPNKTVFN